LPLLLFFHHTVRLCFHSFVRDLLKHAYLYIIQIRNFIKLLFIVLGGHVWILLFTKLHAPLSIGFNVLLTSLKAVNKKYPTLNEQNFKETYKGALESELEKPNPQPVCKFPCQPQGQPPILLKIDAKLTNKLKAFRSVVGVHVVRATAKAFIESDHLW